MWIYADYEPVAAFGLRPSNTTSSGGKTLVCPTPYGIKMALLDRILRLQGEVTGLQRFEAVRDLEVWARVPYAAAINRTFQKVLRPDGKLWTSTIAQREYCFFTGWFTLAFSTQEETLLADLPGLLASINYFGRRGSFMQLVGWARTSDAPAPENDFVNLCQPPQSDVPGFGFLQRMDDMHPDARFEEVSTLSSKPSSDGGRRSYTIELPYYLKHYGASYIVYDIEGGWQ